MPVIMFIGSFAGVYLLTEKAGWPLWLSGLVVLAGVLAAVGVEARLRRG